MMSYSTSAVTCAKLYYIDFGADFISSFIYSMSRIRFDLNSLYVTYEFVKKIENSNFLRSILIQ